MKIRVAAATGSLLVVAIAGPIWAQPAGASVTCTGLLTGTIHDTVVVPPEATCFIANATIHGDVVVGSGADLELGVWQEPTTQHNVIHGSVVSNPTMGSFTTFGRNTIDGNVVIDGLQAQPPESNGMNLCDTTIGGNLAVTNAQPGAGFIVIGVAEFACPPVRVGGYAILRNNNVPTDSLHGVHIASSRIGATLQVTGNTGGGSIIGNTVGGALLCGGNNPPLSASGNIVAGPNQGASGTC